MMSQVNSYEPPRANFEPHSADGIDAPRVASGQKLVIYACIAYLLAGGFRAQIGPVGALMLLPALVLGLVGVVRVMSGLAWSLFARIAVIVLMFVPLVSLITLLIVNSKATTALRNAGYTVGLMGASK
jgi:hypothetical protein